MVKDDNHNFSENSKTFVLTVNIVTFKRDRSLLTCGGIVGVVPLRTTVLLQAIGQLPGQILILLYVPQAGVSILKVTRTRLEENATEIKNK